MQHYLLKLMITFLMISSYSFLFGIELNAEKGLGATPEEITASIKEAGNTVARIRVDVQERVIAIVYSESTLDTDFKSLFFFREDKAFAKMMIHCEVPTIQMPGEDEPDTARTNINKLLSKKYGTPRKETPEMRHWTKGKLHIFLAYATSYEGDCPTDFVLIYSTVPYSTLETYLKTAGKKIAERREKEKRAEEKKKIDEAYEKHKDDL